MTTARKIVRDRKLVRLYSLDNVETTLAREAQPLEPCTADLRLWTVYVVDGEGDCVEEYDIVAKYETAAVELVETLILMDLDAGEYETYANLRY